MNSSFLLKERVEYTRNKKWKHLYKCPFCSTKFIAIGADVNSGRTTSCGCYNAKISSERFFKHGKTKSTEYRAWSEMKRRCYDKNRPGYQNYGGRDILVCERWLLSFNNFYEDLGPKPDLTFSLDRIDNDGNYEPGNVRWADRKTQSRNQRRHKDKKWPK